MLREDRISRITLKEHNIYDFKDWQIYVGKWKSKIARTAELNIAAEQICIQTMNLRMWNIKFDKNLKAKNKLKNLNLRITEIVLLLCLSYLH